MTLTVDGFSFSADKIKLPGILHHPEIFEIQKEAVRVWTASKNKSIRKSYFLIPFTTFLESPCVTSIK